MRSAEYLTGVVDAVTVWYSTPKQAPDYNGEGDDDIKNWQQPTKVGSGEGGIVGIKHKGDLICNHTKHPLRAAAVEGHFQDETEGFGGINNMSFQTDV